MKARHVIVAFVMTVFALPKITSAFELIQHSLTVVPGEVNTLTIRNVYDYPIIVRVAAIGDYAERIQLFPRRIVLLPGQEQRVKVLARDVTDGTEARLAVTHSPREPQEGQHARLTLTIPIRVQVGA